MNEVLIYVKRMGHDVQIILVDRVLARLGEFIVGISILWAVYTRTMLSSDLTSSGQIDSITGTIMFCGQIKLKVPWQHIFSPEDSHR